MATCFLSMPIDAQQNPLKVDCNVGEHGSHDAHGETPQTLLVEAAAQLIHPSIATPGQGGLYHTHYQ
jgi:hypothetical protein